MASLDEIIQSLQEQGGPDGFGRLVTNNDRKRDVAIHIGRSRSFQALCGFNPNTASPGFAYLTVDDLRHERRSERLCKTCIAIYTNHIRILAIRTRGPLKHDLGFRENEHDAEASPVWGAHESTDAKTIYRGMSPRERFQIWGWNGRRWVFDHADITKEEAIGSASRYFRMYEKSCVVDGKTGRIIRTFRGL